MQFELIEIPRIIPEILLLVLGLLVLGSDVFERWRDDDAARLERHQASASLAALGLGMVFLLTLLQSGYVYQLPLDAPTNPLLNIVRNLQAGGPQGELAATPILGAFATDHLTMIGRLIFIAAAFLTVLLTYDARPTDNPGEFYALLILSTMGMCLMAGSSELILTFLAIELTSIPLYILAGYSRSDRQSSEAGMKYFLFGAMSSAILLYGMSLVYGYAATTAASLNMAQGNTLTQFGTLAQMITQAGAPSPLLTLGMLFIVAGLSYKLAVVPFHAWSPDVYQGAPTPVTAFISTASKAAGFVLLFRLLFTVFPILTGSPLLPGDDVEVAFGGWTSLLALLALLTLIVGNLAALPQTSVKRLLAYSSIAHAGFIMMGMLTLAAPLSIDQEQGIAALMYYLVAYMLTNLGAFGMLAIIQMTTGSDDLTALNGMAQRNLGLAALFTIFLFSLAGIPPLAGFFAKFVIFMAAWQAGAVWLVIVGLITTIISLYYYLRVVKAMFLNPPPDNAPPVTSPFWMGTSMVLSALLVVAVGVFPNLILNIISNVQASVAGL